MAPAIVASTENIDQKAMLAAGRVLAAAQGQISANMYKIADVENLATKGLGVVLEQGIYAGLLFFYSKKKDTTPAQLMIGELLKLSIDLVPALNSVRIDAEPGGGLPGRGGDLVPALNSVRIDPNKSLDALGYLAKTVCADLRQTIWVKTVWEQTLTYVRYGAKALEKAGG